MTDVSQPRKARGRMLPAGIMAAALFALLAFAPFASAASDPVASGTTTINLNKGLLRKLVRNQVSVFKITPASVNVKKRLITLPVSGGSMDPTNGAGNLTHKGGIKFKFRRNKKTIAVKNLELNTQQKKLKGKVGGKKMTIAKLAGTSSRREGFGVFVKVNKLKLTSSFANALNKGITPKGEKTVKIFKPNQVLGSDKSPTQPSTVNVLPANLMTLATDAGTFEKLTNVGVSIPVSAPTTEPSLGTFDFPITGGTVGPTGTAGVVQSAGGLQLLQKLPLDPPANTKFLETEINLNNVYVDLAAKTLTVEVVAKSNASKSLDLGNLGRSSIADITVPGVVSDPTTRTVTVTNAPAVLQPVSSEVLEGFVQVYKAYVEGGVIALECGKLPEKCQNPAEAEALKLIEAGAKAYAEEAVKDDHIVAGNPLGTVSFTAQGQ